MRLLAWLVTAPFVVLGVGFVFHTDFEPTVLGKWSTGYAVFLLVWWLLVTPAVFFLARFLLSTQEIELASGRVLRLRSAPKILVALLLGWGVVQVVEYRVDKALGRGVATPQRTDFFHPYLQNMPKVGSARLGTNRWGFRGADMAAEKAEGACRIFALGGSTVFSGPLSLPETWPEVLAARLRGRYPGLTIEMQNAAAEWHTSQHSLFKLLTLVLDLDPDLVLVYHGINDLGRSLVPDLFAVGAYRSDYGHYHGPVARLARPGELDWPFVRIRLGYCFSDFLYHRVRIAGPAGDGVHGLGMAFFPRAEPVPVESWPSLEAFERNLSDIVSICRARGIDVILASQPALYREDLTEAERELLWTPISHQQDGRYPDLASMIDGMERFNATSRRVAEETGAGFAALATRDPKTTEYLWDDVHYTAQACALIAELFDEHVANAGLLDDR